ncbi:MAG: hypothetical protein FWF63_00675 [Fibromonadales bacterium]|nr:hypothetical protein [Fibromonadales bacterium]
MSEKNCCKNCKSSRTGNSLAGQGVLSVGYYFYCANPKRKNALVFEYGLCALYEAREAK